MIRWAGGLAAASILGIMAAGLQSGPVWAADCGAPAAIRFGHGQSQAKVSGGMVRAEEVCYVLGARAGQTVRADISSPDDNVVFSLYRPGYRVKPADDGPDISGATVPGAGEQDDATSVRATLPASGRYLFVLGTARGGGGEYALRVSVR